MDSVSKQIASFIGFLPVTDSPTVRVINRSDEDGYTRVVIQYTTADGERIEAFLFEPASRVSTGCVIALHQHNSQWTIGKSEVAGLRGDPLQAFGPALARRGVKVLAPDAIGFESRQEIPGAGATLAPPLTRPDSDANGWLQYYNQMAHRLVQGDLLLRRMLTDCSTALMVAQDCEGRDGVPLGVLGHSLGGVLALFLGALDARVAFTCSSGAVCSFRHKLATGTGFEMSLVIPGFAKDFDVDDLIRCIAPRHLFVVSSDSDPQAADAVKLERGARDAFATRNCVGHLKHLRTPGGHALDQQRFDAIIDWNTMRFQTAG